MDLSSPAEPYQFAIEMLGISKSFGPVKALDNVTLQVTEGSVHGLVGENGAGKSTLMKILAGLHMPDSGEIVRRGEICAWKNPGDAIASGVAMIYQELSLAPDLTVAENIWLGMEPAGKFWGTYSRKLMIDDTQALIEKHGFKLDPHQKVEDLSASACQIVETLKAIARNARILVMDEPTSSCGDQEVNEILGMVKRLKKAGTTIIYISHKLEEVVRVAENITVLRDGRVAHSGPIKALGIIDIVAHMVGRDLEDYFPKRKVAIGPVVLRVTGLSSTSVKDINFDLRSGEIVGVAGLVGSGRTDLARVLCGLDQPVCGNVELEDRAVSIKSPSDALAYGIMYVTEDRKRTGLFLECPALWSMTMPCLAQLGMGYLLKLGHEKEIAEETAGKLSLKWPGPQSPASTLSGGNQQKLLLGRALIAQSRIWILDEPTRGVDIAAKVDIYDLMGRTVQQGKAILMISSEMSELFGIADRILVMRRGRLVADLVTSETSQEAVMHLAAVDQVRK